MNMHNYGIANGRLTRDPKVFKNSDGSRKVKVTLAVQDTYGERKTQFINLDGFVRAEKEGNGVYDSMHEGDLVTVQYSVRTNNYEKNGESVFDQTLQIEAVQFGESKSVTEARMAKKAAAEAGAPMETMEEGVLPEA